MRPVAFRLFDGPLDLLERTARREPAQPRGALPEVDAVAGELVSERDQLSRKDPTDASRDAECEERDQQDRCDAPQCRRSSASTTGLSKNVSKPASATGIKTARPQ